MNETLHRDNAAIDDVLGDTLAAALDFLTTLPDRPAGLSFRKGPPPILPVAGLGARAALDLFQERYAAGLTGSAGPRYLGFVTGGATPAALAGDWLTGAFDQNVTGSADSSAPAVEADALDLVRQFLGLPADLAGTFVTGATMASFVGLALGRQWAARRLGGDPARDGLYGLPPITVLSGAPHSSILKGLAMLGMGRRQLRAVACLPGREAVDPAALRRALEELDGAPAIIVGNAGTVNTTDFDDFAALAALRDEFGCWLHIDAAFGGFAAASADHRHLLAGWEAADSITVDLHKWLNVPYDAAIQLTRHPRLQLEVFQNNAAYLDAGDGAPDLVHLTPENSRRLRALPAWMTLMAYGAAGHGEIVERTCRLARGLGERIAADSRLRLLAPVRLNVVCFTLAGPDAPAMAAVRQFLAAVERSGRAFLTPTVYGGVPAMRAAFSNWRTDDADLELIWAALDEAAGLPEC
ncbi:MAG TPA: pyridoxal-dependent decarboxylase [Herpetosiphonaceae bacterium]|nr:pyridoxal-dependent decarboxylase [Herpetosiphonaceae bacterium]